MLSNLFIETAIAANTPLGSGFETVVKTRTGAEGFFLEIPGMITALAEWIFGFIAILAVLMIVFGGYQYMTGALADKAEGKQTIFYALAGLVVALLAFVMVSTVVGVVGGLGQQPSTAAPEVDTRTTGRIGSDGLPVIITTGAGFRTDRHNNPTAFIVRLAEQAGLRADVDFEVGDCLAPADGGCNFRTAKLIGSKQQAIDKTVSLIDAVGFARSDNSGPRWTHTFLTDAQWAALPREKKVEVVKLMFRREGGSTFFDGV